MTEKSHGSTSKAKATVSPVEKIYTALADNAELMLKASADVARQGYDTAVSATREPASAALKNGGYAPGKEYDDVLAFGRDNIDVATEVGTRAVRGLQEVGAAWMALLQKSAEEVPAITKALSNCKTPKEATQLQADLAKANLEDLMTTALQFQQLGLKIATSTFEPITKRFSETASKYGKFAA